MSDRKKKGCPVRGCKYGKSGRALRLHLELKEDAGHRKYREEHGIPEPKATREPLPGGAPASSSAAPDDAGSAAEPAAAEAAAPEPASTPAAQIVVDLDEPPAGPLVGGEARTPPEVEGEEAGDAGGGGGPDEVTDAPVPADEEPRMGQVRRYMHGTAPWKKQTNRFVRGALNKWALDPKMGDTPISREEVEELDVPDLIEYTLDWLAEEYGFDPDFNHPAVGWAFLAMGVAGLVSEHRAPRPKKKGDLSQPAAPSPEPRGDALPAPDASPPAGDVLDALAEEPASEISAALDAALGGAKA